MKLRSFVWALMGALFGSRCVYGIRVASASTYADDDLLLVNGWIVRRSQVSKQNRVRV